MRSKTKRRPRPRPIDPTTDIPFAVAVSHLPPNHRPHLLRWLRRQRQGWNPWSLPSALPNRCPHPHRTFYQLDPTTGTWEQL